MLTRRDYDKSLGGFDKLFCCEWERFESIRILLMMIIVNLFQEYLQGNPLWLQYVKVPLVNQIRLTALFSATEFLENVSFCIGRHISETEDLDYLTLEVFYVDLCR